MIARFHVVKIIQKYHGFDHAGMRASLHLTRRQKLLVRVGLWNSLWQLHTSLSSFVIQMSVTMGQAVIKNALQELKELLIALRHA
jgi:hypothetical protein